MKNNEILFDVIGEVDEELIPETGINKNTRRKTVGAVLGSLVAVVVIVLAVVLAHHYQNAAVLVPEITVLVPETTVTAPSTTAPVNDGSLTPLGVKATPFVEASYPPSTEERPNEAEYADEEAYREAYEAWEAALNKRTNSPKDYQKAYHSFMVRSAPVFLKESADTNPVYSPLSLYMALGLCAEVTDGTTRQQLLDVMAQQDIGALRTNADALWNANYYVSDEAKCVLANSLWTNSRFAYRKDTLDAVAENYYASVFGGDPAAEEYNLLLQDWMNKQTDGLLGDYVRNVKMAPESLLTLVSTVNFESKWVTPFKKTEQNIFRAPSGSVPCDFMYGETESVYSYGEKFTAITLDYKDMSVMRLLLPAEGVSPAELLTDSEALTYLTSKAYFGYENSKAVMAQVGVPKFDTSSYMDMRNGLKALGVSELFDYKTADFSSLTDSQIAVDRVEQSCRVLIDEEGAKAAAITDSNAKTGGRPGETVTFTVDRPFVFEILSNTDTPLFIGIVNNPKA